jgi:hypothetical protein
MHLIRSPTITITSERKMNSFICFLVINNIVHYTFHKDALIKDAVQPLQNLKSKHGVLYVTGKKEYQEEKQKWSSLCNR